ncbi:hypothetical protein T11_10110 [Trichinella zimbabwensis]|uniref:Uncharacterized protein n=1 Tax=Trichinella zimbabwensis TaxID=268475 RepID=A0A0V1HSY0_9BILA|nr:hypothetical protein T11_10110 [Trichinella zimbabwensis]
MQKLAGNYGLVLLIAVSKVHFHLPLTSYSTVISTTAIPATTISTTIISNTSSKMIPHTVSYQCSFSWLLNFNVRSSIYFSQLFTYLVCVSGPWKMCEIL